MVKHQRGLIILFYFQRLKDLREDKDLTQSDIAKLLMTTQQQYGRYENGLREIPVHHLITLCKFYNVSADYVLGITNEYRTLK